MKHLVFLSLILLFLSQNLFAQNKRFRVYKENSNERVKIYDKKPLSLFYEKTSWNQSSNLVDKGYIYIIDKETSEIREIKLLETEPDSSIFSADVAPGTLKKKAVQAEIYSAPQSMLKGERREDIIQKLMNQKAIKRKPFLLRSLRRKGQIVDIFDSREAAMTAYNRYKKQLGIVDTESDSIIEMKNGEEVAKKTVVDTSTLQSLFLANEGNLSATNEKNRETREVLMKVEKERRQKVKSNATSWSSSLKKKNSKKAKSLITSAVANLKKKNFKSSLEQFYNASDLVPENEDSYEQYGVSLFRSGKYNQSIVVLTLAKNSKARESEKQFHLGLSYYKLKDYENAIAHFSMVMGMNDKVFSATAAFYKGTSLIEMKEFDKSKAAFQYVLDNSKNPEMDKRAEKLSNTPSTAKT